MATFEPVKEVNACYKALAKQNKGCVKRAETLVEYLKTHEQKSWDATIARLNREIREAKKKMPRSDW